MEEFTLSDLKESIPFSANIEQSHFERFLQQRNQTLKKEKTFLDFIPINYEEKDALKFWKKCDPIIFQNLQTTD